MKKLLVVSPTFNSFTKDSIIGLSKYFDEVSVIVRHKPIADYLYKFGLSFLKTHTRDFVFQDQDIPSNVKVYASNVWYLPFEYYFIGSRHYKSVIKAIRQHEIEFDAVYAHFIWSAGYVAARLKILFGVPAIITAHGYDVYDLPFRNIRWKKQIENVLNGVDYVTTVSNKNLEILKSLDIQVPCKIISNGYNQELFSHIGKQDARKMLGLDESQTIMLSVGHLVKEKGHQFLIKALAILRNEGIDIECYIIGDGQERKKLEKLIKKHTLKNVHLLGAKLHIEISFWMNAADVFVLPSLEESFGIAQIESLSVGTPVVATKTAGSLQLLTEDVSELVEVGNQEDLARGIRKILKRVFDKEMLLKHAQKFSWGKNASEIYSLFRNL